MTKPASAFSDLYLATKRPVTIKLKNGYIFNKAKTKYHAVSLPRGIPTPSPLLEHQLYNYLRTQVDPDFYNLYVELNGSPAADTSYLEKFKRICAGTDFDKILNDFIESIDTLLIPHGFHLTVHPESNYYKKIYICKNSTVMPVAELAVHPFDVNKLKISNLEPLNEEYRLSADFIFKMEEYFDTVTKVLRTQYIVN